MPETLFNEVAGLRLGYLLNAVFLSLTNVLIFLLNHGGSLLLHKIFSCRIKLQILLKTVLVKIPNTNSSI